MNLVPIEHGGQRVLTTQQLAEFYGEPPVKLQQNFSNNRQRYAEGEHFFRIEHGQEGYSKFSSSPYATQPIYLWTEKGALYHAKSLNTDRAWETYDQLVDTYFRVRQAQSIEDLIIMQAQAMKQLRGQVEEVAAATKTLTHRVESLDLIDIKGTPRQRLNAMVRKYAHQNKILFKQGWRDFVSAYNTAYNTNLNLRKTLREAATAKEMTMPEFLEVVGEIEDALRVADKMLNSSRGVLNG